jgi:AcrR family transcriptional regulator
MVKKISNDPRSVRARKALHDALMDLLKQKPYAKISVTEITREAGLARHTFYNHFDDKGDLLNSLIDEILDEFFSETVELGVTLDAYGGDPVADREIGIGYFRKWREHVEVVNILNTVDIDRLLIDRMRDRFRRFLYNYVEKRGFDLNPILAEYFISFNAYAFVGILRQWFRDGMKYPPEVMGDFLNHFAGVGLKREAITKFQDIIR